MPHHTITARLISPPPHTDVTNEPALPTGPRRVQQAGLPVSGAAPASASGRAQRGGRELEGGDAIAAAAAVLQAQPEQACGRSHPQAVAREREASGAERGEGVQRGQHASQRCLRELLWVFVLLLGLPLGLEEDGRWRGGVGAWRESSCHKFRV